MYGTQIFLQALCLVLQPLLDLAQKRNTRLKVERNLVIVLWGTAVLGLPGRKFPALFFCAAVRTDAQRAEKAFHGAAFLQGLMDGAPLLPLVPAGVYIHAFFFGTLFVRFCSAAFFVIKGMLYVAVCKDGHCFFAGKAAFPRI